MKDGAVPLGEDFFIVHYCSDPRFVTTDKKQAERMLAVYKKEHPGLQWRVTNGLKAFGSFCWQLGFVDGELQG